MLDWLIDNWPVILAILALLERTGAMSSRMMTRIRLLTGVISRQHNLHARDSGGTPTAREMVPESARGDSVLDSALDRDEPKVNFDGETRPRVTRRRKLGRLLLDIVPLVSRVIERRNGLDRSDR